MTTKPSRTQRFITGLVGLRAALQGIESVLIDLLAIFTPWLAPIIPASMTYQNMVNQLGFSQIVSLIGAAAVEFLGLSAINTAVEFQQYNEDKAAKRDARLSGLDESKRTRAEKRKTVGAPTGIAILTGAFYVTIVVSVNVILDIGKVAPVNIVAKALLCLLSVVAGVIIALRASHARRLNPIKVQHAQTESEPESDRTPETKAESKPESKQKITYAEYVTLNSVRNGQGPMSAEDLMEKYGISHSTAYQWQGDYRESVGLDRRTGKKQSDSEANNGN